MRNLVRYAHKPLSNIAQHTECTPGVIKHSRIHPEFRRGKTVSMMIPKQTTYFHIRPLNMVTGTGLKYALLLYKNGLLFSIKIRARVCPHQ